MEAEFDGLRARRDVVCAAEGGKEIVERGLVGQVDDRKPQAPFVAIPVEKIVMPDGNVE